MEELAAGEKVIVIVSEEYLKSDNCMRELLGLQENGQLAERIYPIVIPGTDFYKPEDKIQLMRYWEGSVEDLENKLKDGSINYANSILDHLKLRSEIRRNLDPILDTLTRINSLSLKEHQESNYSILEKALLVSTQGEKSNLVNNKDAEQSKEAFIFKNGYKSYSSGENEIMESSISFFSSRMRMAFPGQRGLNWFEEPEVAVNRLKILFQSPISFERSKEGAGYEEPNNLIVGDPIWWWRGGSSMHIDKFEILSPTKVLLGIDEYEISRIATFRSSSRHYSEFIYVETKSDKPSGLYKVNEDKIKEFAAELGYYSEEFAILGDNLIKREEYDDGYAIIDGVPTEAYGSQLRQRYLSPYNFFISAKFSDLNSHEFDRKSRSILNDILVGAVSPDILLQQAINLPKYHPMR